ncbi:hypothetical protein N1851_024614 [Merluccius polli]|uniref:Uncharacterized protein n=1 Tax=Merluccius polli TaxID=89951 RepID=A0AA47NVH2_MERPO|nr:hypothetical protein N1851_024614 [Merluccius polli]
MVCLQLLQQVTDPKPCSLGLKCAKCGQELLPAIKGLIQSAVCKLKELAIMSEFTVCHNERRCQCQRAASKPSFSHGSALLVVQSITQLQTLKNALQPYCANSFTAYNAIWNPEEGSVVRFLQCKGCTWLDPTSPADCIAAEVCYPLHPSQDQIWLSPAAVCYCSHIHVDSRD